jgi:hypothetical protein
MIPSRVASIRVSPVTELELLDEHPGSKGAPVLSIGEKGSERVVLALAKRNILVALFYQFLKERLVCS